MVTQLALAFTPAVISSFLIVLVHAVLGVVDAHNKGEKVDWVIFLKTIIVAAVTAGFISQTVGDVITQLTLIPAVSLILDKILNNISIFKNRKNPTTVPAKAKV